MKKTKFISLALAALMIVGMIPFAVFSASAATASPTTLPTAYPDGSKFGKTEMFVDISKATTVSHEARGTAAANGELLTYTSGAQSQNGRNRLTGTGAVVMQNATGASGIMFYLDNGASTSGFDLSFETPTNRNGTMFFDSVVTHFIAGTVNAKQTIPDASVTYYVNSGDGWVTKSNQTGYFIGGETGANWYYIPFDSFFYHGQWDLNYQDSAKAYDPAAYGISFGEFVNKAANWNAAYITGIQIKAETSNRTLTLGDLYFVYPEATKVPSDNASTSEYLPGLTKQNHENAGTSTATVSGNAVTITGNTGNNVTDVSNNRVWLKAGAVAERDMAKADGIRFSIDTSGVTDTNLLLRLRLKESVSPNTFTDLQLYGSTANATTAPTSTSNVQYVLRSAASVVYLKDANGEWVPYYGSKTVDNRHGDVIEIDANYVGEVYIPMDSFYCSLGSFDNALMSWDAAVAAGFGKRMDMITIIQTYADNTNAADYSVTYSDFQIVYEDVELTGKSISVGNDISMNVFAKATDGAVVESATFTLGADTAVQNAQVVASAAKGGYDIICDGILPEDIAKDINIIVKSKQGTVILANEYTVSVLDYCLELLESGVSIEAKNAAADLIRYASAVQYYTTEEIVPANPIITNTVNTAIVAYGNITSNPTDSSDLTETTASGYEITGAELRLNGKLALIVNVTVPEGGVAKIGCAVDGGEEAKIDVVDGKAIIAVGAGYLNKEAVIKLYVGDATDGAQTLTGTISDCLAIAIADENVVDEERDLVKALYTYCYSVDAYAATLSTN